MLSTAQKADKLLKLFGPTGKGWTTGSMGRTKAGSDTTAKDKEAVTWCLFGGCVKLGFTPKFLAKELFKQGKIPSLNQNYVMGYNDDHRFVTIKKFLKSLAKA